MAGFKKTQKDLDFSVKKAWEILREKKDIERSN